MNEKVAEDQTKMDVQSLIAEKWQNSSPEEKLAFLQALGYDRLTAKHWADGSFETLGQTPRASLMDKLKPIANFLFGGGGKK